MKLFKVDMDPELGPVVKNIKVKTVRPRSQSWVEVHLNLENIGGNGGEYCNFELSLVFAMPTGPSCNIVFKEETIQLVPAKLTFTNFDTAQLVEVGAQEIIAAMVLSQHCTIDILEEFKAEPMQIHLHSLAVYGDDKIVTLTEEQVAQLFN